MKQVKEIQSTLYSEIMSQNARGKHQHNNRLNRYARRYTSVVAKSKDVLQIADAIAANKEIGKLRAAYVTNNDIANEVPTAQREVFIVALIDRFDDGILIATDDGLTASERLQGYNKAKDSLMKLGQFDGIDTIKQAADFNTISNDTVKALKEQRKADALEAYNRAQQDKVKDFNPYQQRKAA